MKKVIRNVLALVVFALTVGFSFGQSNNLQGKAMAAANDCIQSFNFNGLGLGMNVTIDEVGTCPDGSPKYAAYIVKMGHCPGGMNVLCLVIGFPVATVTFDCNEDVESVECFNND